MAHLGRTFRALISAALLASAGLTAVGCSKPEAPTGIAPRAAGETRPNVLLILVDHLGPELDLYGDKTAATPNLDRLAREGEVFTRAYAASGSEDAAYAALLTGVYPQTIGMVQEWVGARVWMVAPPAEIKAFPETLRAAGYDTFHIGGRTDPFGADSVLWTQEVGADLASGVSPFPPGRLSQPFFGEIDLSTLPNPDEDATTRHSWLSSLMSVGQRRAREIPVKPVDPMAVTVPAYLPDSHSMRVALARRYESIERLDAEIGVVLAELDRRGLSATTDIVVAARSGPVLPRAERTVYDSGVHIPLIVRRADGKTSGVVRKDLVSAVDVAPSVLALAGLKPFAWMQGRERFVSTTDPERYVYSTQNRVGAVFERAFAIRDGKWLYIHNLAFETAIMSLARQSPALRAFRAAARHRPGLTQPPRLTPAQARILTSDRPEDELYDLEKDPWQMENLAEQPRVSGDLDRLSKALNDFAGAAPDYSTWGARDLQDLYRPRGVTPTTTVPTGVIRGGRLALESATPGATLLWRVGKDGPWRYYTGPIPAGADIEAKAARYGFQDSAVAHFSDKR
jgi:arylsulfatase A-like enzyme